VLSSLTCFAIATGAALAQTAYPTKPVRIIVPAPPGGATDATARLLASILSPKWNQNILVDNKPGGGTLVGLQTLLSSPHDGHTLLLNVVSLSAIMPLLHEGKYDHNTETTPVAMLAEYPMAVSTGADSKIKSWKDFATMAKAAEGKTSYGTPGIAGAAHQLGELILQDAKLRMQDVPYKGDAQMITDIVGGQIPIGMTILGSALPMIRSGRLTPLAVSSEQRSPHAPEIPTLKEQGVDVVLTSWSALYTTPGVDRAIAEKINRDVNEAMQAKEMQEFLARTAQTSNPLPLAEFQAKSKADSKAFAERAKALNLSPAPKQ